MLNRLVQGLDDIGIPRYGRNVSIAEKTGYSKGSVAGIMSGHAPLSSRFITAVCGAFGINQEWVVEGTGPVLSSPVPEAPVHRHDGFKLRVETKDFLGGIDDWDVCRGYAWQEVMVLGEKLNTEDVVDLAMDLRKKTGLTTGNVYEKDSDGEYSSVKSWSPVKLIPYDK